MCRAPLAGSMLGAAGGRSDDSGSDPGSKFPLSMPGGKGRLLTRRQAKTDGLVSIDRISRLGVALNTSKLHKQTGKLR